MKKIIISIIILIIPSLANSAGYCPVPGDGYCYTILYTWEIQNTSNYTGLLDDGVSLTTGCAPYVTQRTSYENVMQTYNVGYSMRYRHSTSGAPWVTFAGGTLGIFKDMPDLPCPSGYYCFRNTPGPLSDDQCSDLQCLEEKKAKALECGSEENITNWDNTSCTGECSPCTGDGEITEAQLADDCASLGGILFYNPETCSGSCKNNCPDDVMEQIQESCGELDVDMSTFSNISCDALCKGCTEDNIQSAIDDCASSNGYLNNETYSCTATPENGIDVDYECTTQNPDDPDDPDDPDQPDQPTNNPDNPPDSTEPKDPADNPEDEDPETNPDIESEYLSKIKENTDKLLGNSNDSNILVKNIADNLYTSVLNQGILNDNLIAMAGQDSEMLESIYDELVGIKELQEEIKDDWSGSGSINTEFPDETTLIQEEASKLSENISNITGQVSDVIGIDLSGISGLPSWTLPTPFGDYVMDLNDYSFVFDALASVVLLAAYFAAAIIIFG